MMYEKVGRLRKPHFNILVAPPNGGGWGCEALSSTLNLKYNRNSFNAAAPCSE